jgi:hypothetical protein
LATKPESQALAGAIAGDTVKLIQSDDEVTGRASQFARLARAILPADANEARALFQQGLTELDAIGSGDVDFTNELLGFSASLRDGPISSPAALRIAKVCELNNYDSHKFPWPLTAKAFSKVWGIRYLAQIARWHDRDKVDLELTLPATLGFLVKERLLPAEVAVAIIPLVDVVESWDWGWKDLFQTLLDVSADVSLFSDLLDDYERAQRSGGYYRLKDIREVLSANPVVFKTVEARLDELEYRGAQRRKVDRNS